MWDLPFLQAPDPEVAFNFTHGFLFFWELGLVSTNIKIERTNRNFVCLQFNGFETQWCVLAMTDLLKDMLGYSGKKIFHLPDNLTGEKKGRSSVETLQMT